MNKEEKKGPAKSSISTKKSVGPASKKESTSKKRKEDPIGGEEPSRIMGQSMHDISSIIESREGAPMPSRREPSHVKNERKQTGATHASKGKGTSAKKPAAGKK